MELRKMVADLKDIKDAIERSLPPNVVIAMREADIALTLVPRATLQPTIVDISEELAERELLGDMVNVRKKDTGVDNVIFISQKGYAPHAARIKVAIEPPDSINVTSKTASVEIGSGQVVAGEISDTQLQKQVQKFIELNRPVLYEYWNALIDTAELLKRLQSIED
jgi:hypothetical protein